MSVEQARQLVQRLSSDDEFRNRLEQAAPTDRPAVLSAEGYGDVRLSHISQALPHSHGGELSDAEFAAVSGGEDLSDKMSNTSVTFVLAAIPVD
ncbi:MAG: Nif11 family protein [Actinomycetota bacterium]